MQRSYIELWAHTNTIYKKMHITVNSAWGNDILQAKEGISADRTYVWTHTSIYKSIKVYSVNNVNIYLQYLHVLNPRALHFRYAGDCNGLHKAACDRLGLEIARLPRRPVTNAGAGGTPGEIEIRREFCANMRSLHSSSPYTELSRVSFNEKAKCRSMEKFLRA